MITKNKSHLFYLFKSGTNDFCEQKSSAVKASRNRPQRPWRKISKERDS